MLCLVTQLCLTLCHPMDCGLPGTSVHEDSPGKNTEVNCPAFLQGIPPTTWGSNPGLLHCRWILYHLSHQGIPCPLNVDHQTWTFKLRHIPLLFILIVSNTSLAEHFTMLNHYISGQPLFSIWVSYHLQTP